MSNPSLLCVPYRFKTSKLYSQIPDSGLGDFVVTRSASNSATRVNAAGLIELVADNVPRLDYPLGGITAGCPALLVEPSAQNIETNSENISVYSIITGVQALSGQLNTEVAPDGATTGDRILETAITDIHAIFRDRTVVSGTTYTFSIFAKSVSGRNVQILGSNGFAGVSATVDLSNGAILASTGTIAVQNYGRGWYRISLTVTASSTSGRTLIYSASGTSTTFLGDVTKGVALWGVQVETGSIATSYIPTAASPVTRGAETISKTGVSSLIGQTEGTIYMEWENKNNGLSNLIETYNNASGVAGSSSILIQKSTNNGLNIRVFDSLGNYSDTFTVTMPIGKNKVALAYQLGSAVLYLNGSLVGSNSRTYTFSSSRDAVSFDPRGAYPRASAAIYPTRLPNTGPLSLQSLTQ